jgi:hypothetical protein
VDVMATFISSCILKWNNGNANNNNIEIEGGIDE